MSISLGSPFGQFMKILGVAAALFMVGCNQSSVMVGSGESQFCVPAEYAVSTSYPGLWDLSGETIALDHFQSGFLYYPTLSVVWSAFCMFFPQLKLSKFRQPESKWRNR